MEPLQIFTYGGLRVLLGKAPVARFETRKADALLVYLACNPRSYPREILADLLWDERSQQQSLANLRVVLAILRKHLDPYLKITRETIALNPEAPVWTDVAEFEMQLNAAHLAREDLLAAEARKIERAAELYQGEFLEGFYLRESRGFETWLVQERERLHRLAISALHELVAYDLKSSAYKLGLAHAARLLALDSLNELAHRQMMQLLACSGRRSEALAQYETCRGLLWEEFGVEPVVETKLLYEKIRTGELDLPPQAAAAPTEKLGFPVANPYKGLCAFQETDAANFFGREALTGRLVARLGDEEETGRFLAVVGPSGSGKSSLVKAGLIPALRRGMLPGSEKWRIVEMFPGSHPFEELEINLLRIATHPSISLMEPLQRDERGLLRASRLALPAGEAEILLVIDQFEEVFTLVKDKDEARRFLQSLYTAVIEPRSLVRVVVTLRADFYDRPLMHPDFSKLLQNWTEVIVPLSPDELERAIRSPAERVGVRMESGLVATLVTEMVAQPGALPLLQYALTELFDKKKDYLLSLENYQAIGGMQGVLERRAEETFAGLSQVGKAAARQVFLRLVRFGEGASADNLTVPDTRRRVLCKELEAVILETLLPASNILAQGTESAAGAISEALDSFGKARLLSFDRDPSSHSPTVEIAHEALLREWTRLREWLAESRADVRMQRALASASTEWIRAGRDSSFLLHGARLNLFESWSVQSGLALTGEERLFLEASLAERETQRAAEEARLKREAELARLARQQARLATARELAVQAINNLEIDPERSILLALYALRIADLREVRDALHRAVQVSRLRLVLSGDGGDIIKVKFSPDGKTIAAGYFGDETAIWESASGRKLFSLRGNCFAYSPDGRRLATGSKDGKVSIWDLATQAALQVLLGHKNWISSLAYSPDGKLLATASRDETFKVWNLESGQVLFSSHAAAWDYLPSNRVAFSADGKLLFTSGIDGAFKVWGVDQGWDLLGKYQGSTSNVHISPDGRWLFADSGESHGGITLWDISELPLASLESLNTSGKSPFIVPDAHRFSIHEVAFSPDGSLFATASQDSTARVWRPSKSGLELLMTISGHAKSLFDVAFSPDGSRLATASQDGTVRIWDITPSGTSEWFALAAHHANIHHFDLTRDGKYLATTSADGTAKVWDLDSRENLVTITNPGGSLYSVAISLDGSLLATSGEENLARVWELGTPPRSAAVKLRFTLRGHSAGPPVIGGLPGLRATVFSPDGTRLATGGVDGMAKIWDVKTGQELMAIQAHPDGTEITRLAFSPDSRRLATTTDALTLAKIWDAESGGEISTFTRHKPESQIWSVAFSPDGRCVATGGHNGELKIWDPDTGEERLNLVGHTSIIVGIDFSPDGMYLASAGTDGTARVWDMATGEALQVFTSPSGAFYHVAFTPDGKHLIASSKGFIYGFILELDELIHLAHLRLTRWFTPEECRQFLHQEECPPR